MLCENCGKKNLRCDLHRKEGSKRLSCHCGKDSITVEEAMGNHIVESNDMVMKCKWWGCDNPADGMFLDGSDDMKKIHVCKTHREKLFPRPFPPNAPMQAPARSGVDESQQKS